MVTVMFEWTVMFTIQDIILRSITHERIQDDLAPPKSVSPRQWDALRPVETHHPADHVRVRYSPLVIADGPPGVVVIELNPALVAVYSTDETD